MKKQKPITTIYLGKDDLYPTFVFNRKAPKRTEYFSWGDRGLKKITKFRYFLASVKLFFWKLKDKYEKTKNK